MATKLDSRLYRGLQRSERDTIARLSRKIANDLQSQFEKEAGFVSEGHRVYMALACKRASKLIAGELQD